ncbi:MAG: heavy metal translocating P-type ATPase, partial [Chloroflexota bacterium]|nr:heavy metal translocating P-type ATPase [Chloroflexota bacterium]
MDHEHHTEHADHEHHTEPADHAEHADHVEHTAHTAHAAHTAHTGHADPVGQTANAGHAVHGAQGAHAGHDPDAFRRQFWVVLLLTIPVVVWSSEVQRWLGYAAPAFTGSDWIPPILGTVVFVYGGRVFIDGARLELRDRLPGMMTLISLAIVVAFIASWAATIGVFTVDVWWELATLITVMSLGHWLEMRSIMQAQGALGALAELLPDSAERVTSTGVETVPLDAIGVGDVVLVRPGTRVPADGEVIDGAADVDESMISGESRPVAKEPGARVVAGTVA